MSDEATPLGFLAGMAAVGVGLIMGLLPRRGDVGVAGGSVRCGSPWSPADWRSLPSAREICEATLAGAGVVAVIVMLGGVALMTGIVIVRVTRRAE